MVVMKRMDGVERGGGGGGACWRWRVPSAMMFDGAPFTGQPASEVRDYLGFFWPSLIPGDDLTYTLVV